MRLKKAYTQLDMPKYDKESTLFIIKSLKSSLHQLLLDRRKNSIFLQENNAPADYESFVVCRYYIKTGYIMDYLDLYRLYPEKYRKTI